MEGIFPYVNAKLVQVILLIPLFVDVLLHLVLPQNLAPLVKKQVVTEVESFHQVEDAKTFGNCHPMLRADHYS